MKRLVLFLVCIAAVAVALFALARDAAFDRWVFRRMASYALSKPQANLAGTSDLAVLLVGTGSPLPDKSRAGPSTLIAAGTHLFLVDCGIDSSRNLLLWRVPLDHVDAVFVTHFHSDHIAELGEIRLQTWVAGRKKPLRVFGPPGIGEVVGGFNQAYALDAGYRTKHHGAAMLDPSAVALEARALALGAQPARLAYDEDGLKVTAIRVRHDPARPAYGYRFDYGGRSIVVSGDTAPDRDLMNASRNADILVHEGLSPSLVGILHDAMLATGHVRSAKIMHDIPGYHSSPADAAKIANGAKVRLLVFTHIIPMLPNFIAEHAFLDGVDQIRHDGVMLGHDGLALRLPRGRQDIETSNLD
ncbi:MAG: MBL fold metallo-hydrolase [Alphaproteobacteria bacterium]|nr:MBL fold metallo-hydrolase [Alphaproteobacteria bacterium]